MMYPNSTAEKFSLVFVWLFGHRFLRETWFCGLERLELVKE